MAWQPPDDPDPNAILDSARADTRAGSYAIALEKILWFHHNALAFDPDLIGVRLSFALGDWGELAEIYPPARAALVRTRDETEAAFLREPTSFDFADLAALNGFCLNDGARTAELFIRIASRDPELGRRLYFDAEPYLIAACCFEACAPFLDAEDRFQNAVDRFQDAVKWNREDKQRRLGKVENEADIPAPRHARQAFENEIPILIGLLVRNRNHQIAGQMRNDALALVDNGIFRAKLDAAMVGHIPEPSHVALEKIRQRRKELMVSSTHRSHNSGNK